MAAEDPAEREFLSQELVNRGLIPHDNTVDYLLSTVRAGAMTAEYLIASASRRPDSEPAFFMGSIMNWLWGAAEPEAVSRSEVLTWLNHSVLTLAAFSPSAAQLADGAVERMGSVAFLDLLVPDRSDPSIRRVQELAAAGRRIAARSQYNAVREARRARNPWRGIEELNGFETIAGDAALLSLVGANIDLSQLDRVLRSDLYELAEQWSLINADAEAAPSGSYDRSIVAVGPTATSLMVTFEDAEELRENDRRGQMLVWFGTDRAPLVRDHLVTGFKNDASSPREVHYGRCLVSVPKAHRFGEVVTPWWRRVARRSNDGTLKLRAIENFDGPAPFAASINDALQDDLTDEHSALIYIHGYNTSFEAAAVRAAQLGFDLNVDGITGFFSWPSAAKARMYPRDADNVAASEPPFSEFLNTLTSQTAITRLNLIVHSMGNRLVAEALHAVEPSLATKGVKLGAIVLAAPDINVDRFRQLAAVYPLVAASTTMYVSERDRALGASNFIWDSPRAGLTPPITVVPGIDTIEVTDIDVSRLGHGYYAAAHPVLYDIREILRGNAEPHTRVRLRELRDKLGPYWQLTP
ncbi:alpha/beta hydrolase [Nocardioides hankookensis]|uniref:Alpha/beta hydrolase n=1 Tax=Nocardioides hankookensis TaxID=443157 RepID=A0ABW1LP86_9ACTN